MRHKLQLIAQTMLLVFLPAFVLRPVMVTVENGAQLLTTHSAQKRICDAHTQLVSAHSTLRPVVRETSQTPTLTPCYTRVILALAEGRALDYVVKVVNNSPQSFLVLRI
jgi:hypothetical protein